jgi:bifunctional non-homologous end joining protein LigD
MLAGSAATLPEGPEWTYEVKWDGYRAIAVRDGDRVRLLSRNEKDLTLEYPAVVSAVRSVRAPSFTLDGEIVALDDEGRPSFQALQHRSIAGVTIAYYAFDLLGVGRESLISQSLAARRARLRLLVLGSGILLSEPLPGSPARIEREIRRLGLEGVIAKRRDSLYRPGQRSDEWIKVKFNRRQEFVIGGFRPDGDSFDSVLVGHYEASRLLFAGKVRAGFTAHERRELVGLLARHLAEVCPFANLPNTQTRGRWGEGITPEDMKTLRWVTPSIVVEVSFVEWTRDGLLRHPRYAGLRTDKAAAKVVREKS